MCSLPLEQGKCRAKIERWGFNPHSGQCVQFIYGGCGGNGNNFETKTACEQLCLSEFGGILSSILGEYVKKINAAVSDFMFKRLLFISR